jgi:hypothetical protein
MPEAGIRALLGTVLPDPAQGRGYPRAEVYLLVHDPQAYYTRAVAAGAVELSPLAERAWGDDVAYCLDPDGFRQIRDHAADMSPSLLRRLGGTWCWFRGRVGYP